jgi:dinuclear metal center YbgI/SA1388 family protein
MIALEQAIRHLDTLLHSAAEADREGNGIAVEGTGEVRRIGAALNTTFHAIDAAAEAGVDLLLAHHAPWSGIDLQLRERKLERLRERGISLYVAHEALDRAPGFGVADTLARLMGVRIEHRIADDFGVVGRPEDGTLEAWARRAAEVLDERVRVWPNSDGFDRVAIVPGAGGMTVWIEEARAAGCNGYLTGEGTVFSETFAREVEVSLVLASHHATEFPGICALAEHAARELGVEWVALPEAAGVAGGGRAPLEYER